ncbi:Tad3p [Lachancea thermotolerans CBS 6340]|uniref:KLTH0E08448p n=1 Tax=Lachancea thermotolerans (strain ATCC 56472 / CBS 6340 / NRRL Y-8284) TaxID=559295 RepID=C5DHZ5_LACTC|nr:KLTH0E08448p [Lachancea thermotolerans CBS 6340]CAR23406.1 KLTH0E08448p [Lachancea thermotolerans CBS 6340]
MVKKKQNPLRINYQEGIIEEKLWQIRDRANINEPKLVNVWTVDIKIGESRSFVDFIRQSVQKMEPVTFQHIKRIKKCDENNECLTVIVCSHFMIKEKDDFMHFMQEAPFSFQNVKGSSVVPQNGPPTKSLSMEWSNLYWPLVWRGNPNDQILNSYVFDMNFIEATLKQISELSLAEQASGKQAAVVSAFVNPKNNEVIFVSDHRHVCSPLDHSIMRGIRSVAELEHQKKQDHTNKGESETYLCLDFDVYTTHEPCSMCSMALIHSRIKRCIYLTPMNKTGCLESESGDGYCMHNNHSLNSKYEAFRWIGDEYPAAQIESNVCC